MKLVQRKAAEEDLYFVEAENLILDFDHAEIGQWLAEHWNLPESLAEPMRLHHKPEKAVLKPEWTAIVHVADIIVRAKGFGHGGDDMVPSLSPFAWDLLGLRKVDFLPILEKLEPKLNSLKDLTALN